MLGHHRVLPGIWAAAAVLFAICILAFAAHAAAPVVSNVVLAQRLDGSRILDITYSVADADGDLLFISLQLSADGGTTWGYPVLNATGHIGAGVSPARGGPSSSTMARSRLRSWSSRCARA
ncbi:MAG: hypothetical protein IPG61_20165 [bacterium]|nr:hypothetical protein [bacterium]